MKIIYCSTQEGIELREPFDDGLGGYEGNEDLIKNKKYKTVE